VEQVSYLLSVMQQGVSQAFLHSSMEVAESSQKASQNSFQDSGSILFALSGRTIHHAMKHANNGGIVTAAVLRHVYLKESLQLCLQDCKLGHLSDDKAEHKTVNRAIAVAVKLFSSLEISADNLQSQHQVMQHVGQILLQQADSCACGLPASVLAYCLLALIEKVPETVAAAAGGGYDLLGEQAELLTPAFKRISAGKAFSHCPIHKDKACSISAQMNFTMAYFVLAMDSRAAQARLWRSGMLIALCEDVYGQSAATTLCVYA